MYDFVQTEKEQRMIMKNEDKSEKAFECFLSISSASRSDKDRGNSSEVGVFTRGQILFEMSKVFHIVVVLGLVWAVSGESTETDVKVRQGKIGFLSGATAMLGSLAQDLISRSAANSQVLSLNLTNLFILLVLKAIIFGAGAFGYGHGGYGRNVDGLIKENFSKNVNFDEFLSESELLLMLSYLKADSTQKFGCLQRVACEDPRRAKEYVFTGKLILKGSEIFTQSLTNSKYDHILSYIEDAISYGLKGEDCSARYQCEGS